MAKNGIAKVTLTCDKCLVKDTFSVNKPKWKGQGIVFLAAGSEFTLMSSELDFTNAPVLQPVRLTASVRISKGGFMNVDDLTMDLIA